MTTDGTWKRYLREYESIASELGLDPKETVYEEVDQALIKRFVAQGVPFAPQYWSRGREYLRVSNDPSVYYEIVFNLDPARAYISKEYEEPIKALTVAHVLGHSHVFKNNPFEKSRTHLDVALESYVERVHEYERTYGPFLVEKAIDLAFALNPTSFGRKTKKVLDREAYQVKEVSPSEAYFVESSLGVSLDRLKKLYISGGESALRSHRIEDLCKKYGVSFQSLVDLVKRYVLFSSPYSPDREIKETNLPDGEEDLIHFFANEVDLLPDWVRDILRMEGLIYHLTHSDIPLSMVHEGFATWTHLAIMSRSSSPENGRLRPPGSLRGWPFPSLYTWKSTPSPPPPGAKTSSPLFT
jgi:spore cortex formation protein SpoVR/YcgB (stage V sporulation)